MPSEHDDDDHDVTTTVSVSTTSLPPVSVPTGDIPALPTDHPDRPVNAKPSGTQEEEISTPTSVSPSTTATESSEPDNFLPPFFPTFGVSKRTQIWIYGALAIIVLFCAGLGAYLYTARRKRLRENPRDDYEFEILDDQEAEGLNGTSGQRRRRRAGELYDAFAMGDSDDELFSDEESYRDDEYDEKQTGTRGEDEEGDDEYEDVEGEDRRGRGDREKLL
jgi:kexin